MAHDAERSAAVECGLSVRRGGRRWMDAGCFEMMVEDLRLLLREFAGRSARPSAVVIDSRTLPSTPESGARAGYDGAKRRKGSKVHAVVDTLGHLLALHVIPSNEQDRAQVGELAQQVQEITGEHVELAFVDQGYTGESAAAAAQQHGIQLEVVKHTEAKRGFVLLPRRGWSNAVLPRPRVSVASPETMNDWQRLWPLFISSPLLASCSPTSSAYSPEVNNRT